MDKSQFAEKLHNSLTGQKNAKSHSKKKMQNKTTLKYHFLT